MKEVGLYLRYHVREDIEARKRELVLNKGLYFIVELNGEGGEGEVEYERLVVNKVKNITERLTHV